MIFSQFLTPLYVYIMKCFTTKPLHFCSVYCISDNPNYKSTYLQYQLKGIDPLIASLVQWRDEWVQ